MASRSYCFTLNNYTLDELAGIHNTAEEFRYIIIAAEVGKTGTKHLQGYVELWKKERFTRFKGGPLGRANFSERKGDRETARNYCMKDGDYVEYGHWESGGQGKRNDLKEVMGKIKEGKPLMTVMEEHPSTVARSLKFVEKYQSLIERESTKAFRTVDVEVLWGDAGCGKTRRAHEYDEDVFTVDSDVAFPFDGYNGEKTILLDDFYGGMKYSTLLRVLDGHQYRVNVKGGYRYAQWTKIFITSNKPPEEWYTFGLTPALERRIKTTTHIEVQCPVVPCPEVTGNTEPSPPIEDNVLPIGSSLCSAAPALVSVPPKSEPAKVASLRTSAVPQKEWWMSGVHFAGYGLD